MSRMPFTDAVKSFIKDFEDQVKEVFHKVAFDLGVRIALRTRVRTGFARGNWQLAVARMPEGTVERHATGQPPTGAYLSPLATYDPWKGDSIFFVNHVHYIVYLEFGTSTRQGDYMVTRTVEEFAALVNAKARETN